MADLADEALSLVKALGIKQYVLVGHSVGGKVASSASAACAWLSAAFTVRFRGPATVVGVPVIAPVEAFSERPDGS
jgi:pimeloyl-ACP methyl ester carboxylesterase